MFGRSFLRLVMAMSLYASGMAFFWVTARFINPSWPAALGDPGAYLATGLLGAAVLHALRAQERRIKDLEEQLRNLIHRTEPGAVAGRPSE